MLTDADGSAKVEPLWIYVMRLKSKPHINATTLTDRIGLYSVSFVDDGENGEVANFSLDREVWADWRPNEGDRTLNDASLNFNTSARVYIRFTEDIATTWQVERDSVRYTIHSIRNVENRNQYLELILFTR